MTKWIVVGVVLFAAACLSERGSAQTPNPAPQEVTVMPAQPVTMVPVVTRSGLFGRRQVIRYQPVYQPTTGVPVVTNGGRVSSVYYPPVGQQPIIPATAIGTPASGIQQAQAIQPGPGAPVVTMPGETVVVQPTGSVVVQPTTYYEVRRGLFGRMRVRAVRY